MKHCGDIQPQIQSSTTKGGNLKSLPQPVACPVQDLCLLPGISMDGETPAEHTQLLEQCCEWEEKFLPCPRGHQLMPSSRSFHYPQFCPLGYRTASVICSCKIFQLKFEPQMLLFVSVSFLQLKIPVLWTQPPVGAHPVRKHCGNCGINLALFVLWF